MENDFRELETVIMNQKKFTELKHYLGPEKNSQIRFWALL